MRRREFIGLVGAAAAGWPLAAHAQQRERMRRIGVLLGWSETNLEKPWFAGFVQRLAQLGWAEGNNVLIEQHWASGDVARMRVFAKQLVDSRPDVILSSTTPATVALRRETHTIPIVFVVVSDPVGAGLVASLPRPGGNVTGFLNMERSIAGKWPDILKKVAPQVTRAAIMFNPDTAPGGGIYFLDTIEAAARTLGIATNVARVHSEADIEMTMTSLAREQGGLIVMSDSYMQVHRETIMSLASRGKVPVVYPEPFFAYNGGLIAYGPSYLDLLQRAAAYVDRILRGAEPTDLPVEIPTKYDLIINLKTAKALGFEISDSLLAVADEVIE